MLFAIEPTEESLRLVTFNNRVTPFGPIPVDEARKLLKGWLTAISDQGERRGLCAHCTTGTKNSENARER